MAEQGSSTKQLKPTLGFFDLMSSAVGQIIGAGIMSLLPSALKMTGRTVPFAFLIAAVITIFQTIPFVFLSSVVRVRGGTYTQVAMLGGPKFAGMFVITNIMGNVSLAMYGLSLASYVGSLFGWPQSIEKWVGLAVLTIFYILNLLGPGNRANSGQVHDALSSASGIVSKSNASLRRSRTWMFILISREEGGAHASPSIDHGMATSII